MEKGMAMEPTWQSEDESIRLFLGDCLDVLPTLEKVDAVVTDPPYGIGLRNGDVDGHRSKRWNTIQGDESQEIGNLVIDWAEMRHLPIVLFASPWKPWNVKSRNLIVWDKGGAVGGGGDIETCLKRSWELIQTCRTGRMNGPRSESVWKFPIVPSDTEVHIAAKPVELMEALIERFSQLRETVLDPFMGSGTTGVACIRTGRKFIGIEREAKYFEIAKQRIIRAIADEKQNMFREQIDAERKQAVQGSMFD